RTHLRLSTREVTPLEGLRRPESPIPGRDVPGVKTAIPPARGLSGQVHRRDPQIADRDRPGVPARDERAVRLLVREVIIAGRAAQFQVAMQRLIVECHTLEAR